MSGSLLEQIAEAVLYEGHILYPYRASAKKNRQRFTFGRVYPASFSAAEGEREPCLMQTECLVKKASEHGRVDVSVRFLQVTWREIGLLDQPVREWEQGNEPAFRVVPELSVRGELFQTWQEAVERTVSVPALALQPCLPKQEMRFQFPASRTVEALKEDSGVIPGVICRRQEALEGVVETELIPLNESLFKITVRVRNETPLLAAQWTHGTAVEVRTFASTHTLLRASGAQFISLMDTPAQYRQPASSCRNMGTWPVLVGDEGAGGCSEMLSSPIILYDYPKLAPESAGPLFDGTEIDELLTLRIQTLTDEEKREMRYLEPQTRKLLDRAENLQPEQLLKMHGTWRDQEATDGDFFATNTRLESAAVDGYVLRAGGRVRLRPKARADAFDMVLSGQTGVIEAVEQDLEGRVHLAVVLDADPGRDLGMLRQPGHRFFYGLDEVEPLGNADER